VLHQLPAGHAAYLTGRGFFPALISGPFSDGLTVAFGFAILACLIAAIASGLRGGKYVYVEPQPTNATPTPQPVTR
ncbi:MAG: MFS transporter, partial [Pseudonocardiaceae bacterium]